MDDCIIIGGGPAGLSAALTLGRACRRTVVIDDNNPRNKVTAFTHGYLTRDRIKPLEFRTRAQEELIQYPTVYGIKESVIDVQKVEDGFMVVTDHNNRFTARKIIVATGLKDVLPEIDGIKDVYGRSAFICPYCDGWEFKNQPIAVIGSRLADVHFVKALHGWTQDIALFTNGPHELDEKQMAQFQQHNIPVYDESIKHLDHENGMLKAIILGNGTRIERKGIFFNPKVRQACRLPLKLGVFVNEKGLYIAKEDGKTNVDGLYLAGDNKNHLHQIIHAASDGAKAAVGVNMELLKEDWKYND